jgi:hypothetical protein
VESEEKISYYAIIPAPVRYDSELTANAKLMYGEITALCNKNGYCWASNKYFSQLYKCTPQAISKWIKQLEEKKYITMKYTYKGDSKEIEQRIICLTDKVSINVDRVSTNIEGVSINVSEVSTNVVEGYQQKVKDNNTSINNTFNNKKEIKKEYFLNDAINEIFTEFINQRKKLKAVNSERAINTLINKLNKYDDETKYKMIENSIVNSWKDVYELKENKKTGNKEIIPEWFDKKIEKEEMKEEDLEDIMKELRSFE